MDEMRSEIRAAFEKEQAGLAPSAALRRNLVEAVAAQPRPGRNFQWVAVAAAVLLAILVVAGLMSTRLLARHANVNSPHASPARQSTPVAQDYGPPPAGVNLLYVHDPNHSTWLIGYDWTGQPLGTVKLAQPLAADQVIGMAPDGQAFAVGLNAKGGNWTYYDRLGAPISTPPPTLGAFLPMWADDNRHICSMSFDQQTFAWALGTQLPGEGPKQVAIIATDSGIGQTSLALVSCSFHNDQAIVVRTTNSSPAELWVVRISDGKVVSHSTYSTPGSIGFLVGSRDALFIAENSSQSFGQVGGTASSTIIRRISDKSVVASLDPSMGVVAFNGDDSLVLVTTSPWVSGQPTHLAVVNLTTRQPIWSYDGPEAIGLVVAQPGGSAFAISVTDPTPHAPQTVPDDLVIVRSDGSTTSFPQRYRTAW